MPTVPDPTVTWGEPTEVAYLPAVCYGVGCTEEGPVTVSIPWVSGVGVPTLVEVYWGGGELTVKGLTTMVRDITENPCAVLSLITPDIHCA